MATQKLTPKQELFVDHYLINLNLKDAAIAAGYSKKSAKQRGYEVFNKPYVQEQIQKRSNDRLKRIEVDQDMVVEGLVQVARADIRTLFTEEGNLVDIVNLPDDIAMSMAGVEIVATHQSDAEKKENGEGSKVEYTHKFKLNDRMKALDSLAKHLGMYTVKHEHSGKNGGPIETKEISNVEVARRLAFLFTKGTQDA
jgi:phage terminase small subunit